MEDQLFETETNSIPANAEVGHFLAHDGLRLRYALFAATGRPLHGTVLVLPGRNEPIEKYFETIRDLQDRGFTAALFDWRGQGGSQRLTRNARRGHARSFDHHVRDIDRFVHQILLPDCRAPFYVLAHSTGALIALLATPILMHRVRRMVLCAPLLELEGLPVSMKFLRRATSLASILGLGKMFLARGQRTPTVPAFEGNRVTSDPSRYARNQLIGSAHPQIALGAATIGWVRAATVAAERVHDRAFLHQYRIPTLVVAAGADRIVSTRAIEDYVGQMRSGSLLTIDGAQHEILQEADRYRQQFWAAFDAFIPGEGARELDPRAAQDASTSSAL